MKAVIMAGGKGSRLQPLTIGCPKPMVSFINKPVLDHILCLLKRHHIFEVVITVQYLSEHIQNHFGDGRHLGMVIHYAVEKIPLGTAGSVKNAQSYLGNEPFLVISGDAITDIDLSRLLHFHQHRHALATLALKHVANPQEFGVVTTDDKGRIKQYIEKPGREQIISHMANTGIYVLEPEVLALMQPGRPYDFSLDIFPQLLKEKALFGYLTDDYWCDMGTIQSYLKAVTDAIEGRIRHITPDESIKQQPAKGHHYLNTKNKDLPMDILLKNQTIFPLYWAVLSLAMLACDYALGPFIQFPFLFIIPVMLAAWYNGRKWGLAFAISLPLVRLAFSTLGAVPWTLLDSGINAIIRISVLVLIAFLVDHAATQRRALAQEIQTLEGLLPICSFCKKIRNEDNTWEQLELYISTHSEAQFSHGMCPACAKQHYPEFYTS